MGRLFWGIALLSCLGLCEPAAAQPGAPPQPARPAPADVVLVPGPAALPVTGVFTLGFRLRGTALENYSEFPEVEGFKKSGKTRTVTTRTVQGRRFTDLTVAQRYVPYGEGEYAIKPFQLTVNGVVLRGGGTTVRVGPAALPKPANPTAPLQAVADLDNLFGKPKVGQYQDVPDQAFMAVVAEQPRVFAGQGVRVGLYFYLRPADQALLAFHDFNDQLPPLLHELHQPTAWQEPGPEASVTPDSVRYRGQPYLRFRLAENVYYPLTAQPLHFPPLALTMVKFKLLKKPEPGVDNRLPGYKTYYSAGITVQVKPLPQVARHGAVPVGSYQVREAISQTRFRVGESFTYSFGVEGRGNLSAVLAPAWRSRPGLEVYGPEVREEATTGGGRKLFRYRLVAQRPGPLPLDSLLSLVVFDPATAHYDTLRPEVRPIVRGAATIVALPKPENDPFYGPALGSADATMQPMDVYRDVRYYADWLLVGLAAVAGVGWWRAGRRG